MANPFSSPFGGQKTLFGVSSTQPNVFGYPAFGQQSSIGQTSQSSVNSSNLFGQNERAAVAPSTLGSTAPSTATSSSLFGQSASFAQPGQSMFSVTGSVSKTSASSAVEANSASTGGSGLFASSGHVSAFRSDTKFRPLFGTTSAMPSSQFSAISSLFSGNASQQSSTAPSSLLDTTASTANASSNMFTFRSQPTSNAQTEPEKQSSQKYLFGKPMKEEKKENLPVGSNFQHESQSSVGQTHGLFSFDRHSKEKGPSETRSLQQNFVIRSRQEVSSSVATIGSAGMGLFGKGRTEENKSISRGPSATSIPKTSGTGLFGKGRANSKTLFGKTVKDGDFAGGASTEDRDVEEENPLNQREKGKSSARKLFGKPVLQSEQVGRGEDIAKTEASPRSRLKSSADSKDARLSVRRQMSEDIGSKVAIQCRNVMSKYNTVFALRNHFGRFGEVTKVFPNTAKMQATVHFKTHEAAAEAKRLGRVLERGKPPMTIYWSSYSASPAPRPARGPAVTESGSPAPRPARGPAVTESSRPLKRSSDTDLLPQSKRTSWKGSDVVDEELQSMAGTEDMKIRISQIQRSPEKRSRTISPTPSTSSSTVDIKPDKIQTNMFQGVVARTTTERAHLLTLRDKYIRQNRGKKKTDMVKAFVGTCPDMCPERERYDREDRRQLSYYEIIPGTENIPGRNPQVDHRRAVKEYLRSSPDQDEPLPHELRPLPVLQATMTYLLQEIVNQGEDGRWGDWFDFLWNRTRGIRKDIIQQQLSDPGAVDLIEKCARFHIYCSERLCEEDMHAFDAKINNENLTKCLQTLKEFYADLEKKHKIFCPNEAEFRAYRVLMNLNEGDILREVQQLRPEIRSSPTIKFALSAYFALNANNYIKFFRLVRQASFLNACILHRYFRQIRNKAASLMMRGYRSGSRPALIPVTELVRLLGFESKEEVVMFCSHYGFRISDGEVTMDRMIEPETALPQTRSVSLIESKLQVTVGELINGDLLSDEGHPPPVSSFDEQGRFHSAVELPALTTGADSSTSVSANVQTVRVKPEPAPEPAEVKSEPLAVEERPTLKKVSVELIKDSAKTLFWEVIDELCRGIGEEVKATVDDKLLLSEEILVSVLEDGLQEEARKVSESVHREASIARYKALQLEHEQRKDRVADALTDILVSELVIQEVLSLATIEVREVKAILRQQCIERVTVDVNTDLVEDVVMEMINNVSEDVFEVDVRQRLKQLDDIEALVKLSRSGRFWNRWKSEYKAVVKLKRGMEEFPCTPSMQSTREQLRSLIITDDEKVENKKFYMNNKAKLTIESPLELEKLCKKTDICVLVHRLYRKLLYETAWAPLDIGRLVGRHMLRRNNNTQGNGNHHTVFWKMLLCLPEEDVSDCVTPQLCDWLRTKFSKGTLPTSTNSIKGEILSLYRCPLAEKSRVFKFRAVNVGVCVRSVEGFLDQDDILAIEEDALFLGTSALLFLLPAGAPLSAGTQTYMKYWSKQRKRLTAVLNVKPWRQRFPLVVMLPVAANDTVSDDQVVHHLSLEKLVDEEYLCEVYLVVYKIDDNRPEGIDYLNPNTSEQLCESVQWMVERAPPVPELRVQHLKDLVDIMLQKHYYTRIQTNLKKRKELHRLEKEPNSLLELYNKVVNHIGTVLTADALYTVSWPVSEFTSPEKLDLPARHWNKGDHLEHVYQLVQSLALPDLVVQDEDSEDWADLKRDLWQYMSLLVGKDYSGARIKLFSRFKKMIHSLEEDFSEACHFQYGESECQPTYCNIPWSMLLAICIDYRLDTLDLLDPDSTQDTMEELKVAYFPKEMEDFEPPEDWRHIESDKSVLESPTLEDTIQNAVRQARKRREEKTVKTHISVVEDPDNVSEVRTDARKTSTTLISSLKSERRKSDHFQKYLENALKEGSGSVDTSHTDLSFSVQELENQSFNADISAFSDRRRFSFDPSDCHRQIKFDATAYFDHTHNISAIFNPSEESRQTLPQSRRKSEISLTELSLLPGKKRRQRLSEVYNNDPVMMYLREPSMKEDMDNLKENLKASRRESDLFEKKLMLILKDQNEIF